MQSRKTPGIVYPPRISTQLLPTCLCRRPRLKFSLNWFGIVTTAANGIREVCRIYNSNVILRSLTLRWCFRKRLVLDSASKNMSEQVFRKTFHGAPSIGSHQTPRSEVVCFSDDWEALCGSQWPPVGHLSTGQGTLVT